MKTMALRIPQKAKNWLKHLPLAFLALVYYRFPSRKLKVIGVTGTDGKTTTVNLIYHLLHEADRAVGMVSTVSARIGSEEIETGFHVTASNPWFLQKLLRKMIEEKNKYLVLEVTSHGLDQFRFFGIDFEIGILTNIAHEHLDYHGSFKNYRQAKLRLFQGSKTVILNKDDPSFDFFKEKLLAKKLITYSLKSQADFTPKNFDFKTKLIGDYNRYNCLAAAAAAFSLGLKKETIKKAFLSFPGLPGRMEEISEGQNFKVIIDFAHTPQGLEQTLKALKKLKKKKGKLIVVFGCAGERDKQKRPMMGEIAGKLADLVVLTAEDPRTEKVRDICQQIALGCQKANCKSMVIVDRTQAIEFAVSEAQKNDIVVICGKGHEKTICFGRTEYPWSDQEAAKKVLEKLVLKERKKK
ncbi:MAG TPA: UDP-N-acetylmuramoyl-L-alanyl-D-glutamate--2,6-diaminopimelate ligase [Clostridia bacterium]|nr:UDP-N-acetylmuramoyl-L-alanyl-D-glutamate--2,6-diaminopimelate ligase [Clostridia bacterium]